jgi:hypothetical protein
MPRTRFDFRRLLAAAILPLLQLDGTDPYAYRLARLDANRIAAPLSNVGAFGTADSLFSEGLEFPRGSGIVSWIPFGLWIGANVNGAREAAIHEFYREWRPGPMVGGTYALFDTTYQVYKVSRSDTTGHAAWMAHAVPLGAPTDSAGTGPGVLGSQTLWTVYNDADPTLHRAPVGLAPLGVEVRQTVWAFKEKGPRDNVVMMRWRIENKGVNTLDSVYVGIWSDTDVGGAHSSHFASDSVLAMVYSYPSPPDTTFPSFYGDSIPAVGVRLLEGARATPGGPDLGATTINLYFEIEPNTPFGYGNLLRGLEMDGRPLIDPTTGLQTRYRFSGDPRTGTGWIDTLSFNLDGRTLISSGPFTMAPGDTQQITAALVIGWGPEWQHSLDSLYVNAQTDFFAPLGEEYADPDTTTPPPPDPTPGVVLDVRPNPSLGTVRFTFTPADGESYRLALYDVRGRRLGTLGSGTGQGVPVSLLWASPSTVLPALEASLRSPWPGAGLYFAVLDVGGRRTTRRVSIIDQ